jgi:hypothetical protein
MEVAMAGKSKNLLFHLAALPDPRELRGQRHLLLDVLVIAVLATLCGVDEWEGIEDFALEEEAWLRTFLVLPNGIPSHDTFNRIFRMIDVGAFNACFLEWVNCLSLGVYPDVGLKEARDRRDAARKLLADGVDPSQNRKA